EVQTHQTQKPGKLTQEELKQPQYHTLTKAQQAEVIWALNNGFLDDVPVEKVQPFEQAFHKFMESNHPEIEQRLMDEKIFTPEIEAMLKGAIGEFKNTVPY